MSVFSTNCKLWADTALSLVFPDVCQICGVSRAKIGRDLGIHRSLICIF